MKQEAKLQLDICKFLDKEHPFIPYHSDLSSGMTLSPWQAVAAKKLQYNNGMPDMYIFVARHGKHGLVLEIKADGTKLIRDKDARKVLKGESKLRLKGDCWDDHIEEQATMLGRFIKNGYEASFVVGMKEAKLVINTYLNE